MEVKDHDTFDGKITWLLLDGSEVIQSDLRAIFRPGGEIVFDCRDELDPRWPISYTVTLKHANDSIEGSFKCTQGGVTSSGPVRGRLYSNSTGFVLVGTWIEEAKRYDWFAQLGPSS